MLRYQALTVVGYLAGTAWLVREMYVGDVDESDSKRIEDPVTRFLAYTAFAMVSWLPLALYFVWLWVRGVLFSVVLAYRKIAHHLRAIYTLHVYLRRGITILACGCPYCARKRAG